MSLPAQPESLAALIRRTAARLREAFAGDARAGDAARDAHLLVGHVLGLDATGLVLHAGRPVTAAETASVQALVARRALGEPVARITGSRGFWTLDLALSPETLVPRPDTETVVSAALAHVKRSGRAAAPLAVLDLGTGSGAILLALLSELPAAWGLGVDRAEGAVRTAALNAARHRLGARARFAVADWAAALSARFDLVVSNPPYIPSAEIARLAVDVRDFDPDISLDGGIDGLCAYRAIIGSLDSLLAPDGTAFLEVGAGQAEEVAAMAGGAGYDARRHRDLGGIDRVVELRRGKASRQKMGLEIGNEKARFRSP